VTYGTTRIRARYPQGPPNVGDFVASRRPRFAYRVVAVERIDPSRSAGRYNVILTCERWSPEDVPHGATVHTFVWDVRKRRRACA